MREMKAIEYQTIEKRKVEMELRIGKVKFKLKPRNNNKTLHFVSKDIILQSNLTVLIV